jgi:hypothetical protein
MKKSIKAEGVIRRSRQRAHGFANAGNHKRGGESLEALCVRPL